MKSQRKTTRKLLTILALAALMCVLATSALAADYMVVRGGYLNLRETASLDAKVLGQYGTGTWVEVLSEADGWAKVNVGGKSGYMMVKFLTDGTATNVKYVRTNTGIGLNLREEPSLSGKLITSFKPGTKVTVLQKGASWSRVSVDGKEGFMATSYLNFGTGSGATDTVTGKKAIVNNPKDTQVLNLRQEASLDAKVLGSYHNGTSVTILKAGTTWHKVQVEDGKTGYMMAKYLKVTGETGVQTPFTATLFNVNGGKIVNFRKTASLSGTIIRTVPVGTKVTVLEHGTDWCKVDLDGTQGYISTWFLKW